MLSFAAASILCFFAFPGFSLASGYFRPAQTGEDTWALHQVLSTANARIQSMMQMDLEPYSQALDGQDLSLYDTYANNAVLFMQMSGTWESEAADALGYTMTWLEKEFQRLGFPSYQARWPKNSPTWKYAAALYKAYGDKAFEVMKENLRVSLEGVGRQRYVVLTFASLDDLGGSGTREQMMSAKFAYYYLNTVYDQAGEAQITPKRVYPAAYLAGLQNPLPGNLIKNCWFDPRDHSTRLHTGADIRANARTRIRSVTDGVVLYIGYMDVPGNYVVIQDPYGYEYHYYHMYKKSTFVSEGDTVKAGDVIGLVGNTGNSAANHLHVAVIAPDQCYINPYELFLQAGFHPIRRKD